MKPSIKAFIFDVYGTLFDVHSIKKLCNDLYPGKGDGISQSWRAKQIEYFFLRQLMGNYEPFLKITKDALKYAIKEHHEDLHDAKEKQLIEAYLQLSPYPEVPSVLKQVEHKQLVVFSNGSHDMLDPLIQHAGLSHFFDNLISIDEVKQYKPTLASYQYALDTLGINRDEVLFMSSNGWDISGAKNFGFHTAWINRNNLPTDELNLTPDNIYSDLTGILEWI